TPTSIRVDMGSSLSLRRLLRCGLCRTFRLTHAGEGVSVDDVGYRSVAAFVSIRTGSLAPAGAGEAILFAEKGNEDPRLLLAESGEGEESAVHLATVGVAGRPECGRIAVPIVDEAPAQGLDAGGHAARVTVDGRWRPAYLDESFVVLAVDRSRVECAQSF